MSDDKAARLRILQTELNQNALAYDRDHTNTDVPRSLYHYTNLSAFRSIINSGCFWLTDIRYLNDADELSYATKFTYDLLVEMQNDYKSDIHQEFFRRLLSGLSDRFAYLHIYCASFSEKADELSQWRGYAVGASGVSLGLDLRAHNLRTTSPLRLVHIVYDQGLQRAYILGVMKYFLEFLQSIRKFLDGRD